MWHCEISRVLTAPYIDIARSSQPSPGPEVPLDSGLLLCGGFVSASRQIIAEVVCFIRCLLCMRPGQCSHRHRAGCVEEEHKRKHPLTIYVE